MKKQYLFLTIILFVCLGIYTWLAVVPEQQTNKKTKDPVSDASASKPVTLADELSTKTAVLEQEGLSRPAPLSQKTPSSSKNSEVGEENDLDIRPIQISETDPTRTGVVERIVQIKEADEYYLAEYTNTKFPRNQPEPQLIEDKRPNILWHLKLDASVCGQPVRVGNDLIVATYDKQVFKLDAQTGNVLETTRLWNQPIGNALAYKDQVIIPQRNGNITSLNQSALSRLYNSRSAVHTKPDEIDISISGIAIDQDKIFVSKHWGNLYILRAKDGQMLMDPGIAYESRINIPAVFQGNRVIFTNVAGDVFCFSTNKNKQLHWQTKLPTGYATSMLAYENYLYFATTEKKIVSFDIARQEWRWKTPVQGYGFNSLHIHDDQLYTCAGNVYALSLTTGKIQWQFSPSEKNKDIKKQAPWGFVRGSIVIDAPRAYALTHEGELTGFTLSTGERQVSLSLNESDNNEARYWNSISRSGDYLIASNDQKSLMAISLDSKSSVNLNEN